MAMADDGDVEMCAGQPGAALSMCANSQGRRAISGGSVTGNLFEAMANARFSAESQAFAQYSGPAAIRFESLQVAGEG